MSSFIPTERIERHIYILRGQKVMLDFELAVLYQVPTKVFNQAVKRNLERFPEDFMFRLTREEWLALNRSQIVTGSQKHRDARLLPYAFTEHGVAMLSAVLKSRRAVQVNIHIIRAFIKLREVMATHKDFAKKLEDIEHRLGSHDGIFQQHAAEIRNVFRAIRQLMTGPKTKEPSIGFKPPRSFRKG